MPKRLPPNNRPWSENIAFDFGLPSITPDDADRFIDSLPTSDRNNKFLRLRYRDGKLYDEIASVYGITPAEVRGAVKRMWERFGHMTPSASTVPPRAPIPASLPEQDDTVPRDVPPAAPPSVDIAPNAVSRPLSINLAAVRRLLNLTPEEFSRPFIDDGGALITRLETGFSKPSA